LAIADCLRVCIRIAVSIVLAVAVQLLAVAFANAFAVAFLVVIPEGDLLLSLNIKTIQARHKNLSSPQITKTRVNPAHSRGV
jgi:hypothetical protein